MAHAADGWLRAAGTLDLEGLTLERGELSTGAYGEGYVDRRHPHAYVHELLVGAQLSPRNGFSVFVGRGFAPFGSDDPMMRPFEKYPVNHHLAQVLERLVAISSVRRGPVIGEIGTFNGDEPTAPGAPPDIRRFGDSWASRLTVLPWGRADGLELSGSVASVASPEIRVGQGLDQTKRSLVARFDRASANSRRYALIEWAHTAERDRGELITSLSSVLGEGAYCRSGVIVAARLERTDRPEEEQLGDPFRTPRPPPDLSNLGVSRWTTITGSVAAPSLRAGLISGRPFIEVARVGVSAGEPAGIFNPDFRYGTRRLWMLSAGVRLRAGSGHDRMGRYGAAMPAMSGTDSAPKESDMMPGMPNMPGMSMSPHAASSRCAL
jgi:hypothetical protein